MKARSLSFMMLLTCSITNFLLLQKPEKEILNFHINTYLKNPYTNSFFLKRTDCAKIKNIISSLNINKASCPHSTPNRILKYISKQLAYLFSLSFSSGVFLPLLKIVKLVSVYKKDSNLCCSNYCTISLLSNVEKILEKVMYKKVYNFLTKSKIISLCCSYIICGIIVDLQKTFNTVDHEIVLAKLSHYGIRCVSNNWLESYLSNTQQFVSINVYDSDLKEIVVFLKVLYFLYMNDLSLLMIQIFYI